MVAHEIRAPLQALTLSVALLAQEPSVQASARGLELASTILRQSLWLEVLMDNLLCAAAIGSGRFHIQRQTVELDDLLASIEPVVRPALARKQQRLTCRLGRALPSLHGDRQRLGQVLINLLVNASKYSPPASPIHLHASPISRDGSPCVKIVVSDRGPGLPPTGPASLFAAFTRGASVEPGNGLGLPIVRSIVEAHGGAVGAARRRGGGASFWFTTPAVQPTADAIPTH